MRSFPLIPIWIMVIVVIITLLFTIKEYKKNWQYIAIVLLLFIVNLRVMYPGGTVDIEVNNLDVLFVIDNTISMEADDHLGTTRLEGIKKDCQYLVRKFNGARFALVTFHNQSKIVVPFTNDSKLLLEAVETMTTIDEFYSRGSSLNVPQEEMLYLLKLSSEKEGRERVVFYISDGEITNDSSLDSFKEIKNYAANGAVLGYGTESGGKMKVYSELLQEDYYILDKTVPGNPEALSKLDEKNLQAIANDIGIDYINMTSNRNGMNNFDKLENLMSKEIVSSSKNAYSDTYFFLFFPIIALFLLKYKSIKGDLS